MAVEVCEYYRVAVITMHKPPQKKEKQKQKQKFGRQHDAGDHPSLSSSTPNQVTSRRACVRCPAHIPIPILIPNEEEVTDTDETRQPPKKPHHHDTHAYTPRRQENTRRCELELAIERTCPNQKTRKKKRATLLFIKKKQKQETTYS